MYQARIMRGYKAQRNQSTLSFPGEHSARSTSSARKSHRSAADKFTKRCCGSAVLAASWRNLAARFRYSDALLIAGSYEGEPSAEFTVFVKL